MRLSRSSSLRFASVSRAAALLLGLFTISCGGGDSGGTGPTNTGGGSFFVSFGSSLSIAQGSGGSVSMLIARTGSFTGPVSLSVSGLPTGVTGTFSPATVATGQTTAGLTLTSSAAAALGTTTVTVTGSSPGLANVTSTLALTITGGVAQTGPFSMALSVSSYLVLPANQLQTPPLLTISRNAGFTGSVALTTTGLPFTLAVAYSPSTVTGASTSLLILDLGGTPPGTYTATIQGTAAGGAGTRTITLPLVVANPTTGSIHWKFCSSTTPQFFVAVKDGSGAWTRVVPGTDSVYSFNIASPTGSVAMVTNDSGGFRTTVYEYSAAEMTARAGSQCALYQNSTTRTVNGTVAGVTGFRTSEVGMSWWDGSANGNGSFSLLNLPPGPLDVVAVSNGDIDNSLEDPVIHAIIRRGVNPGSTLPVLDFGAAESFAPTTSTWTINGVGTSESMSITQTFITAGGTTGWFGTNPGIDRSQTTRTIYGFPVAQTIAGDLHQVVATINTVGTPPAAPNRGSRQIIAYARTLSNRTVSFGPAMPAPTVTAVAAGRLRAAGTLPTEYSAGVSFDVTQTSTARFATVHATSGFLGTAGSYDVQVPDLTSVTGWDTQFAIRSGVATNWWVSGGGPVLDYYDARYIFNSVHSHWTGAQTGIVAPADGATYLMGRAIGAATP